MTTKRWQEEHLCVLNKLKRRERGGECGRCPGNGKEANLGCNFVRDPNCKIPPDACALWNSFAACLLCAPPSDNTHRLRSGCVSERSTAGQLELRDQRDFAVITELNTTLASKNL